jgi:hypothetical protein
MTAFGLERSDELGPVLSATLSGHSRAFNPDQGSCKPGTSGGRRGPSTLLGRQQDFGVLDMFRKPVPVSRIEHRIEILPSLGPILERIIRNIESVLATIVF